MTEFGSPHRPLSTGHQYKRILLTGGAGFVGGYLAPLIVDFFPDAERAILRRPGTDLHRKGWTAVDVDLKDSPAIKRFVSDFRPDLVLHLAAQSSVAGRAVSPEETWRVNFLGTMELASACARMCPEFTFFFVSSSEVYGLSFLNGAALEDWPLRPISVYSRSKAACEAMLGDLLPREGSLVIVRPFNHTGPGQDRRFVLSSFAAQIAGIEAGVLAPTLYVGNLSARRDFLHVRDVCSAYMELLNQTPQGARQVYNISSGKTYAISHLVEEMRARCERLFEIAVDPTRLRPSDIPVAAGNSDRLVAATQWAAVTPIETTLDELLDYWRAAVRSSSISQL
jgi:GDP-4-dehydro-6-deoxy-D-mannose reductase